jgi:flagellar biosynthesis/type III secretory pathway ATPase
MPDVTDAKHRAEAAQLREWLAMIRDSEDLVSVGAYVAGSNPRLDTALARRDVIQALLCQPAEMTCAYPDAIAQLASAAAATS